MGNSIAASDPPLGLAQKIGLFTGPVIMGIILLLPASADLPVEGQAAAAIGCLMAIWWMTEAVPLAVTALLPLVLFPVLGVTGFGETAKSYAHPLIFLFLGGFMLARAMAFWNLHKRLAFFILRIGGNSPEAVVASLMVATAFLSLWVSNTATTMVMLPIGMSIVSTLCDNRKDGSDSTLNDFGPALMLGIAYAATIGGMGSIIGTPPNALFAAFMRDSYGIEIGFAKWMMLGVPIILILLPLTWFVLTRLVFQLKEHDRDCDNDDLLANLEDLGPMSRGERLVAVLMVMAAGLWVFRPLLNQVFPSLEMTDAGIAMTAAVLLFVVPVRFSEGVFLLKWDEAVKIRWDVLILFGGGLALAAAISGTGLAAWISTLSGVLETLPFFVVVLAATIVIVYLGELASNTAMAAIFLPIAGATAIGLGQDAIELTLPVVLAASLGFMLPVATPPNAIVYGSGAVTAQQMLRAGALINIIGIAIVVTVGLSLGSFLFSM
jgi:sodium-dependent dicarboxylate transporter 2/3/5